MNTDRWRQIDELFQAALLRPAAERSALLERECGGDISLRAEVESLLTAHDDASSGFIDSPAFTCPIAIPAEGLLALPPNQRIGCFTVRSVIGLGGMSVVYEAEQDEPNRRVALKILRTGLLAPELVRRFSREAELLGRLQHPGIAQIYEAGTGMALGLPYIVMELVRGEPITKFAEHRGLDLRQRIELFTRVCDTMEYAHQQGVIHRDLKPANIIVTSDGQPKILDFGAALLRDADSSLATFVTMPGQLVGTLPYMSPEQAGGDRLRIGVGSDVYSLGVVLFQLLTGRLPHDLTDLTLVQMATAICTKSPAGPGAINPAIDATLDSILMTALSKQPADRHPSAAALAAELRRYLQGQRPIHRARPRGTRFRSIAGWSVAGTAAIGLAVCAAWAWSSQPGQQSTTNSFAMVGSPFRPDLNDFLGTDFAREEESLRRRTQQLGTSKGRAAHEAWRDLGELLELQGRFPESEQAYRAALAAGFPPGPDGKRGSLLTEDKIAGVLAAQGATDQAGRLWVELISRAADTNLDSWQVARLHLRYGILLHQEGRRAEAVEQMENAIRELESEPGRNADHLLAAQALLESVKR